MHESALDQASGLRRVMAHIDSDRRSVINLLGTGEHPLMLARLAQAWSESGLQVTVITDFDSVFQAIHDHRRRFGLSVVHAFQLGLTRGGIMRLAAAADLTVLALDDNRLARGLDLPGYAPMVMSGTSPESVATAYLRLKAGAGLGSPAEVCTLFDRDSDQVKALTAHQRLAQAASRFLGLRLSYAGVAPGAAATGEWRTLADALSRWAGQRVVESRSAALH